MQAIEEESKFESNLSSNAVAKPTSLFVDLKPIQPWSIFNQKMKKLKETDLLCNVVGKEMIEIAEEAKTDIYKV